MKFIRRSIVLLLLTLSLMTQGVAVAMAACMCPEMPAETPSMSHDHHQHAAAEKNHSCCQDKSEPAEIGFDMTACDQCDCNLLSSAAAPNAVMGMSALPSDSVLVVGLSSFPSSSPFIPFRPPIL